MALGAKRLQLVEIVNSILAQYDGPLTLRQIFYRLVAAQVIENLQKRYKSLSEYLTQARREGLVDPDRIVDRTRRTLRLSTWNDLREFMDQVRRSYRREKWTSQDCNVEVWCEKDALAGVLEPITEEYEVLLYPCRGYNSYSALLEAARRIANRPLLPQPTVILYFGDYDPSGKDMPRDIRERLRQDFGVQVELREIALTLEQITEYDLPPAMAKRSDSRAAKFIAEYGDMAVELDALPPDALQQLVRDSIEQLLDKSAFQAEIAEEELEQTRLQELIGEIEAPE